MQLRWIITILLTTHHTPPYSRCKDARYHIFHLQEVGQAKSQEIRGAMRLTVKRIGEIEQQQNDTPLASAFSTGSSLDKQNRIQTQRDDCCPTVTYSHKKRKRK